MSGLAPRLENDPSGVPGRRALTCYLTWHQVSRGEGAQRARVVRGAGSAQLIGDCAQRRTRSAPPAAPPRLPPPLRRGKVGAERGGRPGQLTGGAGLRGGAGPLGAGPELALPPLCSRSGGPRPNLGGASSLMGLFLWRDNLPAHEGGGYDLSFLPSFISSLLSFLPLCLSLCLFLSSNKYLCSIYYVTCAILSC